MTRLPKMILFDFGETLHIEPSTDFLAGERAVFRYVSENPNNATPEEVYRFGMELFESYDACRKMGFELHERQGLLCKYGAFGITFSIPLDEVENILWDNVSKGRPTPYVKEMLGYLNDRGIRTGVISNIGWSGQALQHRIEQILPEHRFAFIIASSEYIVRKPNPLIFRIALKKARLSADEVWYCGDSLQADVIGAHGAGLFPVWYDAKDNGTVNADIDFPHLHIRDWRELVNTLEAL